MALVYNPRTMEASLAYRKQNPKSTGAEGGEGFYILGCSELFCSKGGNTVHLKVTLWNYTRSSSSFPNNDPKPFGIFCMLIA